MSEMTPKECVEVLKNWAKNMADGVNELSEIKIAHDALTQAIKAVEENERLLSEDEIMCELHNVDGWVAYQDADISLGVLKNNIAKAIHKAISIKPKKE